MSNLFKVFSFKNNNSEKRGNADLLCLFAWCLFVSFFLSVLAYVSPSVRTQYHNSSPKYRLFIKAVNRKNERRLPFLKEGLFFYLTAHGVFTASYCGNCCGVGSFWYCAVWKTEGIRFCYRRLSNLFFVFKKNQSSRRAESAVKNASFTTEKDFKRW